MRGCASSSAAADFTGLYRVFLLEREGAEGGDDGDDDAEDQVCLLEADLIVERAGHGGAEEHGDLLSKVRGQRIDRRIEAQVKRTGNVLHDGDQEQRHLEASEQAQDDDERQVRDECRAKDTDGEDRAVGDEAVARANLVDDPRHRDHQHELQSDLRTRHVAVSQCTFIGRREERLEEDDELLIKYIVDGRRADVEQRKDPEVAELEDRRNHLPVEARRGILAADSCDIFHVDLIAEDEAAGQERSCCRASPEDGIRVPEEELTTNQRGRSTGQGTADAGMAILEFIRQAGALHVLLNDRNTAIEDEAQVNARSKGSRRMADGEQRMEDPLEVRPDEHHADSDGDDKRLLHQELIRDDTEYRLEDQGNTGHHREDKACLDAIKASFLLQPQGQVTKDDGPGKEVREMRDGEAPEIFLACCCNMVFHSLHNLS